MKKIFSLFVAALVCAGMWAADVYFVNADGWTQVNAYMWGDADAKNAAWPGVAMTKTDAQAKGFDVYSYEVPTGFSNLIFNNGDGTQTSDLTFDAAKPYFYANAWYASLAEVEAASEPEKATIYFINDEKWETVKVYVFEGASHHRAWPGETMTKTANQVNEKDVYSYEFPKTYSKIIFHNGEGTQTNDLIYDATKTYYSYANGTWYATLNDVPTTPIETTYYLVGSFNDWAEADANYVFAANPENEGEYFLSTTLAVGVQFKVIGVKGGTKTWYPGGDNTNYIVDEAHAGEKTIYFRPDGQGGEGWHHGCIYVESNTSTGIDATVDGAKAVKVLRDGMLLIEKGGKSYNVLGAIVR